MDDRRFENTTKRVKRLVLDFEQRPNIYRDLEDFLDIIDYYAGIESMSIFSQNDNKMAEVLRIAETIYPSNTDIKVQRARLYMIQGHYESAFKMLLYLEKLEPDHVGVLMGLADCYFNENKIYKGISYLKRILEIEPNNVDVYDLLIQQSFFECKVDEAFQYFKKRIELKSDDDDEFLARVNDAMMSVPHISELAIKFFEYFIEINPYSSHAWTYLAMSLYDLNRNDEALEACEYALAISDECTAAYLTKFEITNDRQVLYDALDHVPEKEKYHINMQFGESYFRIHQYAVAAPYYRSVIKFIDDTKSDDDFNNYFTRNKLANCYMRMGDPGSAEKLLLESIDINPYNALSYDDLAILYKYEFHDAERFEQTFSDFTQKYKDCKHPWIHYLKFLVEQKRYDDVVDLVVEAEKSIPDDDDLYIPLAVAYYHTNRKNEAYLLLNNMNVDNNYLEDMLRKYSSDILSDSEVMNILLQKRDETDNQGYYPDDDICPNVY